MENQLINEIRTLDDNKLLEHIVEFQNRVETTQQYLAVESDVDISMVMRVKLREYSYKLRLLMNEQEQRNRNISYI